MKVLVTGAAGFIGFHTALHLADRGDEVVCLDVINDYYDVSVKYGRLSELGIDKGCAEYGDLVGSDIYPNLSFIKLDLTDYASMSVLFESERFDAVCNLAAQAGVRYSLEDPQAYINSNVVGFQNILELCRHNNVSNLSYASSSSVYGLNEDMPFSTHSNVDHPMSLYAATKKANELMAHTYSHLYGIRTTGLRFFTVYGPWGRPDMALFLFADAAIKGKSISVFNHGEMLRDFTYIDDIVGGIVRVIDNPAESNPSWDPKKPDPASSSAPYKVYNIGNNSPVKLMSFIEAIESKLGFKIDKKLMPIQPGDVPATFADASQLIADLDYRPATTIEYGIDKFINWYLDFFDINLKDVQGELRNDR